MTIQRRELRIRLPAPWLDLVRAVVAGLRARPDFADRLHAFLAESGVVGAGPPPAVADETRLTALETQVAMLAQRLAALEGGGAPCEPPGPVAPPAPPAAAALGALSAFAAAVAHAARACEAGHGTKTVLIKRVWWHLRAEGRTFGLDDMGQFRSRLAEAHRHGLLRLCGADVSDEAGTPPEECLFLALGKS